MTRTRTFLVEIKTPVANKRLGEYVRDAIRQWAKGGDPEDPLFDLTDKDITVTTVHFGEKL